LSTERIVSVSEHIGIVYCSTMPGQGLKNISLSRDLPQIPSPGDHQNIRRFIEISERPARNSLAHTENGGLHPQERERFVFNNR
jgi:hypothetical protein